MNRPHPGDQGCAEMPSPTTRYAAVGDSFTEGVGDELPDGRVRGWADHVAAGLARSGPVEYVNLAIRGRLLAPIATEQLEAALALGPTVLTFNGGGDDLLRPRVDLHRLHDLTEQAIVRCQRVGVQLVLLSGANPSRHLPMGRRIDRLGSLLTDTVAGLAEAYGVTFVDNFNDEELSRAVYWSADRLHLGPAGHRRVAARVLQALGQIGAEGWMAREPGPDVVPSLQQNARYYREHVVPWVLRRVRRQSSGTGREPKVATWHPVQ